METNDLPKPDAPSPAQGTLPARESSIQPASSQGAPSALAGLIAAQPWVPYVLPLLVFMLVGSLEPTPPPQGDDLVAKSAWAIPYAFYPLIYSAKLLLTLLAVSLVRPMYRQFPWRLNRLAITVGVMGAVLWIGLCYLRLEPRLYAALGLDTLAEMGQRSAYNPLAELKGEPALAYGMLAIRFCGLVLVVPLIEEFFLRGFLVRFVVHPNWWSVPFGDVNLWAVVAATVVPVLMHPGEAVAAAVWFSLITWLMVRTRNIWDCVVAHAVTNFLLGVYVVLSGDWRLL